MAECHQATSHYLNQCWHRSLSPHGGTRPQWVHVCVNDGAARMVGWYHMNIVINIYIYTRNWSTQHGCNVGLYGAKPLPDFLSVAPLRTSLWNLNEKYLYWRKRALKMSTKYRQFFRGLNVFNTNAFGYVKGQFLLILNHTWVNDTFPNWQHSMAI